MTSNDRPPVADEQLPAGTRNHLLEMPAPPLRAGEKVVYGLGDFASNLTWTTISSYLLFFYTNVALIPAAVTGVLFLVARIIDAVIDPLIGLWMDRTNTRFGRARPFILFGAVPLGVMTVLSFVTPSASQPVQIAWAFTTFLLVGMVYSLVNVPYGALMPMMTRDSKIRLQLGSLRITGLAVATLLVSLLTIPLVGAFGNGNQKLGFALVISLYAVIAVICFFVVFAVCKERVYTANQDLARRKEPLRPALRAALRNRAWLSVVVSALIAFVRLGIVLGGAVYYALYILNAGWAVGILLTSYGVAMLVGSAVCGPILTRLGRRKGVIVGLAINVVATTLLFTTTGNAWTSCVLFFVASVFGGFGTIAAPPMLADTVDYQELVTGSRNEGLLYSVLSFGTKVGNAIGSALFAGMLGWFAYDPQHVTGTAKSGISLAFVGVPIALAVLQAAALWFYDLEKKHAGIVEQLRARERSAA